MSGYYIRLKHWSHLTSQQLHPQARPPRKTAEHEPRLGVDLSSAPSICKRSGLNFLKDPECLGLSRMFQSHSARARAILQEFFTPNTPQDTVLPFFLASTSMRDQRIYRFAETHETQVLPAFTMIPKRSLTSSSVFKSTGPFT